MREKLKYSMPLGMVILISILLSIPNMLPLKAIASNNTGISSSNIVFILDASGSMRGKVSGKAKIDIAKQVLVRLINELPEGLNVGLVAYGHRRKGDCNDVEDLVPLGKLNKKELISKIKALQPKGKTPINYSIRLTAEKLQNMEEETTIVLVSDGKETCGGDPCALVMKLKESGIRFVMHVVGFDVTRDEKRQLECIAKAGGGNYYAATNASEFHMAMKKVVLKPQFQGGVLKITALKDGKPFQALVRVYKEGKDSALTVGYTDPPRPYSIKLLPGKYRVTVQDGTVPDKPIVELKGIVVTSAKSTGKTVEFAKEGTLKVTAIKDGKPFQALVRVYKEGKDSALAVGYTDPPRPYTLKLLPGIYNVKVQNRGAPNNLEVTLDGITIESGRTENMTANF